MVATVIPAHRSRRIAASLALYALVGALFCFGGWAFDVPRLTDWFNDRVSMQPNTAVLIALAGAGLLLLQLGPARVALGLGAFVAFAGGLNLLQYVVNADFGFNQQLLFGRSWGSESTVSPGRFGPPASIAFVLIGTSLALLCLRDAKGRRYVPGMALFVMLLMMFSLLGYLYGARDFYAIPWLSAIALPTATMLMALAIGLIVSVPERQPMALLCETSSAGAMARTVLPILIAMIPASIWFRGKGSELRLFDVGTGRALSAATLTLGVVGLMWVALMALRRREQREREADQRKDEFLAMLAHELRNPLAPIRNATSLLKLAPKDTGIFEEATETIERQVVHLVRLIDDLLDVSRISRGKLELRRERVELAPIIRQANDTCRSMAESARLDVTTTLPPKPVYVYADPVRLAQVVSNLLHNACKFVPEGGRISLTAVLRDDDVVISVKDNGIGIAPDKLDSIFEMFSQIDQSLERSQGGLGIGLTLAKRLVELHDGSIEAHSDGPGKGTEIVVRLPVVVERASPPPAAPEDVIKPRGNRLILVVDDNQDSARSLSMLLKVGGNETFLAYDGEEAIEAAATQRPDVILLDIGLPKLNGYDACRRIREQPWAKKTLIIALTGWGQDEDRRKSAEAGFDGHLVKPVELAELTKLLNGKPPQIERQFVNS